MKTSTGETTAAAPVEAAEPTSAAEYYETPSDRAAAEAREDRVNDKLYTMGQGKIADRLQKMPIGEDRENNYIKLEDKLLKGKQAGPGMQAMAKPPKPLTLGETQALIKKLDEQSKAVDQFVKIANGEASSTDKTPPKAAAAVNTSVAVQARKGLIGQLQDMWGV